MNALMTSVKVMRYKELPVQAGISVLINDQPIAIFKVSNGNVYAVEDRSPHPKGGVLSGGLVSGEYVYCPVYDWKISLKDGKVQAPDEGTVKTYKVEVINEYIQIIL